VPLMCPRCACKALRRGGNVRGERAGGAGGGGRAMMGWRGAAAAATWRWCGGGDKRREYLRLEIVSAVAGRGGRAVQHVCGGVYDAPCNFRAGGVAVIANACLIISYERIAKGGFTGAVCTWRVPSIHDEGFKATFIIGP